MTKNYPQKLPRYLVTLLPSHLVTSLLRYLAAFLLFLLSPTPATATPTISNISDNRNDYPTQIIPTYKKIEIHFSVNTSAPNFFFPHDTNPPAGMELTYPMHNGISVDALFLPPGETNWDNAFSQPAFYFREMEEDTNHPYQVIIKNNQEWFHPTGNEYWVVRFSPDKIGRWHYRLKSADSTGNFITDNPIAFDVVNSSNKGFIRVSQTDPRYFEFSDGSIFYGQGFSTAGSTDQPILKNQPIMDVLNQNGFGFLRNWISGMYGSAWTEWIGGRNLYDGYLPRAGLLPFRNPNTNEVVLVQRLDHQSTGWFDACRFQFWNDQPGVKQNTTYQIRVEYWGQDIAGPRVAGQPFGFVAKTGGWIPNCHEPGVGTIISNHGGNTNNWSYLEGTINTGSSNYMPRLYLAAENMSAGRVYFRSIQFREVLPNNQFGPNLIKERSMEYPLYTSDEGSYVMDKKVQLAENYGQYLKLVLMEKDDNMYLKIQNDGSWVEAPPDNLGGFYGIGRQVNKTRWLQQAWWRYAQARWGYSTAIHSWEVTNEGDPANTNHFALTDEMAKFFKCRVFGITIEATDGTKCDYNHPNHHLVTTSFWHSFPVSNFFKNTKYPNIDYGNVHAYISTSNVLDYNLHGCSKQEMVTDAAAYHLCHSTPLGGWNIGKPIVRGEAGMDSPTSQDPNALDIQQDNQGVWFHNYLWSQLNHGALYEIYWWGSHIWSNNYDHRSHGRAYRDFINNIPLNNGHYQNAEANTSNPNLRVTGQKDSKDRQYATQAHLWIHNTHHLWSNRLDITKDALISFGISESGVAKQRSTTFTNPQDREINIDNITLDRTTSPDMSISNHNCPSKMSVGQSCSLTIRYVPQHRSTRSILRINYWYLNNSGNRQDSTYRKPFVGRLANNLIYESATITIPGFAPNASYPVEWWNTWTGQVSSTQNLTTNSQGVLSLTVTNLEKDTAVKIGDYSNTSPPEIPYSQLIQDFGSTTGSPADLNNDGIVNIFDFNLWISQPQ